MNRRTFFKGVAALCCAPLISFSKRDKLYISPEAMQDIRDWMPNYINEELEKRLSLVLDKHSIVKVITWT